MKPIDGLFARGRRPDLVALAVLAGLVLFLFRDAAFRGRFFYERDIWGLWRPQAEAFVRVVAAGSWPLWNPFSSFGAPLLATPNTQVLYPPTWLLLVLQPWTYYKLFVLFHVLLGGAGIYALARHLGASRAGSLVGALVGVASGPLLSLVSLWNHLAGMAWMPWIVLAGDFALSSRRASHVVWWSAALAMSVLAGSPEMGLLASVANVALGLRRARWPPKGEATRRVMATAALATLLALGLSAGQWLPSLELARRSARAGLAEEVRRFWSIHPVGLLEMLVPVRFGDLPLQSPVRAALYGSREAYLPSVYLGLPAFALVGAALAGRHRFAAGALLVLVLLAILGALGGHTPFYRVAVALLPPLKAFRFPVKALVLAALAWALLAALGYDAWREGAHAWRPGFRRALTAALLFGGALIGGLALVAFFAPERWGAVLLLPPGAARNVLAPAVRSLGVGFLAVLGVLAVMQSQRLVNRGSVTAPLLAAFVVGELVFAAQGLNPTVPRNFFTETPPILEHLRAADGSRLYVTDYSVPGMSAKLLGHESPYLLPRPRSSWPAPWHDALALRAYLYPPQPAVWGLEGSYEADWMGFQPDYLDALVRLLWFFHGSPELIRLLQLGAVSRVVALHTQGLEGLVREAELRDVFVEPIRVYRIPNPLPRAFVVSGVRTAHGHAAIVETLLQFEPRREVLLTEAPEPRPVSASFAGRCRILELRPDHMRLDVDLNEPGAVVTVDTYDPGWQASIDGQPARVLRANVAFRAVPTPAGRHTIDLVYRPLSVIAGLAISAFALVASLSWGVLAAHPPAPPLAPRE
jgi:hypothetical protein